MGAKKGKGKKGKSKKSKGGLGDDIDPVERNWIFQAEIESLSLRLMSQQQRADRAKASEIEKMNRQRQNERVVDDEKKRTNDIIADMTRQYKATQEELLEKHSQLGMKINQNDEDIKKLTSEKEAIQAQKRGEEAEKDDTIYGLKKHIENMSNQFQNMLKETLEKMQKRIESANKQWQEENEAKMLQKFEEIVNPGNSSQ